MKLADLKRMRSRPQPQYGIVKDQRSLGHLLREHRRHKELTLDDFYQSSGITTRFMSELERGKITSVGRLLRVLNMLGLELVVLPRAQAGRLMGRNSRV